MDEPQFEWDEAKDQANQKKHGISFRDAARVFSDPLMLLVPDGYSDGEERWRTYGQIGGIAIIMTAIPIERKMIAKKSASSRPAAPQNMKGKIMNSKMVRMKLNDLPPLTQADQERLAALAARPDDEIDLSDIPELDSAEWKNAIRGNHYRPTKAQITAHLDKDVLAWLKADGRGYQTRMNAILRREMLQAKATGARK